jgi:opacity protein-like surface antigen
MKSWILVLVLLVLATGQAMAQDKPRVFVQGKGSQDVTSSGAGTGGRHWGSWGSSSTVDSHDEGMEVTKNLQKECSAVIVTLNQSNADYTVMLNRESKKNRGLLRTNSQIQVSNRLGDVLGTDATHTVGNASKDACQLIMADWSQHGRIAVPADPPASAAAPVAPATGPAPAKVEAVSAVESQATTAADGSTAPAVKVDESASLGDAAKRMKQRKACLELAKDNPSILCN